jgi:hypothetical protein
MLRKTLQFGNPTWKLCHLGTEERSVFGTCRKIETCKWFVSCVIIRFFLEAYTSISRSKATKSHCLNSTHRDAATNRDLTFWLTGLIWTINTCSTVNKSTSKTQLASLETGHTFLLCLFNCVFQVRMSYAVGSQYIRRGLLNWKGCEWWIGKNSIVTNSKVLFQHFHGRTEKIQEYVR